MKLHSNNNSYLRTGSEGKSPKRLLPKITQLIYIIFLIAIILYIAFYFVNRSLFIDTTGLVEVEKIDLGAIRGGPILYVNYSEGDQFDKGDVLAGIGPAKFCQTTAAQDNRKQKLEFDIADEKIKRQGLQNELRLLNDNYNALKEKSSNISRALEVNAPLLRQAQDLLPLETRIKQKQNEIALNNTLIASLTKRLSLIKPAVISQDDPACSGQTLLAPFDGKVFSISLDKDEVANRGDIVLTVIDNNAPVVVELFINPDQYQDINTESEFSVVLPNGVKTTASISTIESKAIARPNRVLNDYTPVIPGIKVSLTSDEYAASWKEFDRYAVQVRGLK